MKHAWTVAALVLALTGSFVASPAAEVTLAPATTWSKTDVPADPSITFGTLPNGMRYLIKHNTHPEHAVSFFLRIATGSFDEAPKQAGMSHFIEHMAFRGTTHIPDGEAFKRMEKIGAGLGTDSNAFTYPDSTIYTFDFPHNDQATLDTALTLTRDIASEITFDPKAVESERQVVLAEFRLRDTPVLHMARASQAAMFGDQLAEAYVPIGTQAAITSATPDELKAYYRAHYQPQRAVLMVVGDIDQQAVEKEIKARFADWKPAAPAAAAPHFTYPDPPKAPQFKIFVEPGAASAVQMSWIRPYDSTPETRARDARDGVREIAMLVLSLRLRALATSADPPFLAAGGGASNSFHTAFVTMLGANVGSGDPLRAVKALRQSLLTVLRDGVTQNEVDQAIIQARSNVTATVTAAGSRKSNELTGGYSATIGRDSVIDAPENWLPSYEAAVKGLTAERVTAVLREIFGTGEPLVFVASPAPVAGGEAALATAFKEAGDLPATTAAAPVAAVTWPYTDFGPEGTIATRKNLDDLGATAVTFANGVRATIKPTKFQTGQVMVLVRIGHGQTDLPKDKIVPHWAVAGAWAAGGVKRVANADLPKALNGRQWGAAPEYGWGALSMQAQTQTSDLETELQFIAAFVTDPAWRPEGLQQVKSMAETGLAQAMTTPGGVYGMNAWAYPHNNDLRSMPPTLEAVKATDLEAVKALVASDLANGPIEVIIVGDITLDEALAKLKRTFGALPKRRIDLKPIASREELPKTAAAPYVLRHKGATQEAVAMLAWKTTSMFPDTQTPRVLSVLEAVMRERAFNELRTKQGITYAPQTLNANSWGTPGWGFLSIATTVPDGKLADFYASMKKVAADLRTSPIPDDEFERARGPLVSAAERAEQTNGYWLQALAGTQVEPRALELMRKHVSGLKAVTANDVWKAAQTYLIDERSFRMIVVSEGFSVPADLP